ncbi:plasmid fertility inhibition factor family protein [Ahniella affigens]|uniref:plasmid fertility inhibition factor family protein n=1 Tax=Ahniella affigens TaxID=2021234 RepID=UPI003CCDF6C1
MQSSWSRSDVTYLGLRTIWSRPSFLFAVATKRGPVFMRIDSEPYGDNERCVVVVRSEAFIKLWRQNHLGIHFDVASKDPDTWPLDYKYASAERGFAVGEANPVPLADVSCHEDPAGILRSDQISIHKSSSHRSLPHLGRV